jgi:hypothetical protein
VIKDQVEELIEESYLLSLSEAEIRNYLRNFLESCEYVLSQMIGIHEDVKVASIKVALLKVKLLLSEWSHYAVNSRDTDTGDDPERKKNTTQLVRQVMDIKILIFNLLDRVNPKLREAVVGEMKNRRRDNETVSRGGLRSTLLNEHNLIGAGYIILLLTTIFILSVFLNF